MCVIANQNCQDGLIKVGDAYRECKCIRVQAARLFYQSAHANENYMRFPNELDHDPRIVTENQSVIRFKDLIKIMDQHTHELIDAGAHLFLSGERGTGKSQFAQTLLYLMGYRFYKEEFKAQATYLDCRSIRDYLFDFETKRELHKKIKDPLHKVLILDDIGAEMNVIDNTTPRLIEEIDQLIRMHNGLIIFVTNLDESAFAKVYNVEKFNNAGRLLDYLMQNKKFYFFPDKNLRQMPSNESSVLRNLP